MKKNINNLDIYKHSTGGDRKIDIYQQMLKNSTLFPITLEYKDIDKTIKEWVDNELKIISDEGKLYPTITMFSNQRFSEYLQSWSHTDEDNNILLNFKSISRENNPQYGKIQNGLWNIPGDRFYTMARYVVMDNNGSESLRVLSMKQPVSIDLVYKISIFTSKYEALNEFNTLITKKFASRQCYIYPNGHPIPMILEDINDDSQYNIDDRQYYSQSYNIVAMAYIITEDDYKIDEVPLKTYINIGIRKIKGTSVEFDENPCGNIDDNFQNQPQTITINFNPNCSNKVSFNIGNEFVPVEVQSENINLYNFKTTIDGEKQEIGSLGKIWHDGQRISLYIVKWNNSEKGTFIINGYTPEIIYDENTPENEKIAIEYEINPN